MPASFSRYLLLGAVSCFRVRIYVCDLSVFVGVTVAVAVPVFVPVPVLVPVPVPVLVFVSVFISELCLFCLCLYI